MKMTVDELVTELTMSTSYSTHILVEGYDDIKFFCSALQGYNDVNFLCAWGAEQVMEAVEKINEERSRQKKSIAVLGVIDRDYRIPTGTLPALPNLVVTDHRDLECMMINSPSFAAVLNELGSVEKIKNAGGVDAIRSKMTQVCRVVGELRYFSYAYQHNFSFQQLDYEEFVDKKTLKLDSSKLVAHLSGAQKKDTLQITTHILSQASAACEAAAHPDKSKYFIHDLLVCRGHDLVALFSIGLRSRWGSRKAAEVTVDRLESYLRAAYIAHFPSSDLYKNIIAWITYHGSNSNLKQAA